MDTTEMVSVAKGNLKWMRHQERIQRGNGARSTEQWIEMATTGDESLVGRSEGVLSSIEDKMPVSLAWRNVDDVVGAIPNVPTFLAGHPQCMRRRQRTLRENAPVTIYMDLTSSMGIASDKILRRGITLLALVRMLVEHRATELWVGTSLSNGTDTGTVAWRIDTTPLDLARAAFHISDVSMSRLFGYATAEMLTGCHLGGFGDRDTKRLQEIAGWNEVIHIPPVTYSDPLVDEPVKWLKRTLAKYTGGTEDAAA
jgi:hypothetical protein